MEFNASHGYYKVERAMKQKFIVNLDIVLDFSDAAINDELSGTINYEDVYKLISKIMDEQVILIEHIAYKIGKQLKSKFKKIESARIEVQKRDVQLGGKLEYASVILDV